MSEQDRDQRTELPTEQRLRRAFEEGQVALSSELLASMTMAVGMLFFLLAGAWFFGCFANTFRNRLTYFDAAIFDQNSIRHIIDIDVRNSAIAILSLLIPIVFVTVMVGAWQTNFNLSFKPLELKVEKLSIYKGFERIFSSRGPFKGVMAITKAAAIISVAAIVVNLQFDQVVHSGTSTFGSLIFYMANVLLKIGIASAAVMVLISLLDLVYQKWKHIQDLRMSRRDIQDEHRDAEGDPQIRARLRKLRNELGTQRISQAVATADVIITNPTHFAVALKYDVTQMIAPKVVAKGADHLAQRIIELAKENNVPVVERKPVARFLYFNIKIGKTIPPELYAAVAEVLNFVNRARKSTRWLSNGQG